jgi:hypothetical protein
LISTESCAVREQAERRRIADTAIDEREVHGCPTDDAIVDINLAHRPRRSNPGRYLLNMEAVRVMMDGLFTPTFDEVVALAQIAG